MVSVDWQADDPGSGESDSSELREAERNEEATMGQLSVREKTAEAEREGAAAIEEKLGPTSSTPTRIGALLELGIDAEELAGTLAVTPATVRNWVRGTATPRREAVRVVDDLRQVVVVLHAAGLGEPESGQWLRSRQSGALENDRPLDVIREDPVRVLATAHGIGLGDEEPAGAGLRTVD